MPILPRRATRPAAFSRRVPPLVLALAAVVGLHGLLARPAAAQVLTPEIPPFVVDLRGFWSGLGQDAVTASELGIPVADLPGRGFGAVGGVHVYLVRRGKFALGAGGEAIVLRTRRSPEKAEDGTPTGPIVTQNFRGLSAQVSLNFGDADGWSYLTGGMGPTQLGTYLGETAPVESPPSKSTINLGGGARWFPRRHIAVTFDLRFYLTRPEVQTPLYPGRARNRVVILSGGIAIK